ncbi:hypothetical protein O181_060302 [Austropuccinia psidii MF-1]|uniref:Uncharacterized protein n=1 Tax=Austropuccinia psidii MF-1 TaxID=1389203 RepID=A0A9Q3HYA9_9BASI|nr:hypothetical protein [Austropuccinia psidii MF-1]
MPVQHSPPAKNTRYQRNPAVLTPTARVPLDCTPSVQKLSAKLDRGPPMEGAAPSRRGGTKSRRSRSLCGLLGEVPQGSNLTPSNKHLVSQSDPSLLNIMEQMDTLMGQLSQAAVPRDSSKAPSFKTPSMKAPDSFDGTQSQKSRGFIQSCQLISHNDPANFFSDRNWAYFPYCMGKWHNMAE